MATRLADSRAYGCCSPSFQCFAWSGSSNASLLPPAICSPTPNHAPEVGGSYALLGRAAMVWQGVPSLRELACASDSVADGLSLFHLRSKNAQPGEPPVAGLGIGA